MTSLKRVVEGGGPLVQPSGARARAQVAGETFNSCIIIDSPPSVLYTLCSVKPYRTHAVYRILIHTSHTHLTSHSSARTFRKTYHEMFLPSYWNAPALPVKTRRQAEADTPTFPALVYLSQASPAVGVPKWRPPRAQTQCAPLQFAWRSRRTAGTKGATRHVQWGEEGARGGGQGWRGAS